MKRLWISVVILSLILLGTLGNSFYLSGIIDRYELRLSAAQEFAEQGAWSNATLLTQQVMEDWDNRTFYFHVLMRHTDTDEVYLTFREVQEYLRIAEYDQYTAANARLITQLGLLAEMEQPTLKNIL